jgi:lipopolysaccharide/colanic/teichoic acid biosynthesis glycosyltransferase
VVRAPTRRYLAGKRALDLVVCTLLLVIAIPVIAVCALAIRLDTSGRW